MVGAFDTEPTPESVVEGSQSSNQSSPDEVTTLHMLKHSFCVFCGANPGSHPDFQKMATDVAHLFHAHRWTMVYGGSNRGLMGTAALTLDSLGGEVIGIKPRPFLTYEPGGKAPQFSNGRIIIVDNLYEQKVEMLRHSDAFVILPGGFGTLEEIVTIRLWQRSGIHKQSIVLFNFQGFYDNLLTWIEHTTINGFASKTGADVIVVVNTLEELRKFLSTESCAAADRTIGDMSSLITGQGKLHRRWENPRPFQKDANDPGTAFVDRKLHLELERLSMQCRENSGSGAVVCTAKVDIDKAQISIGKRNVIFRVIFDDAVIWVARVRIPNSNKNIDRDPLLFKECETDSMRSEVASMRFIQQHSTIPIPHIYAYDAGWENPVGAPYMLLENIPGKPFPFPFNNQGFMSDAQIEKVHSQLAECQHQLSRLAFKEIGQLYSNGSNSSVSVGPIIDKKGRRFGPFHSSREFYISRATLILGEANESGTEEDQRSALLHLLAAKGMGDSRGPFTLKHQDLHRENVLLDDECNIRGIVDWTWCSTAPPESQHPIPFNLANYIIPRDLNLIGHHNDRGWELFEGFRPTMASISLSATRGSRDASVARFLDNYSSTKQRQVDFEPLMHASGISRVEFNAAWEIHRHIIPMTLTIPLQVEETVIANNPPKPTPSFPIKTIHIIRHGEALHNIDRTYNLRDPPLTDKGFAQAEALHTQISRIFKIKPSAIVTSPMTRTIQTARILFPSAVDVKLVFTWDSPD